MARDFRFRSAGVIGGLVPLNRIVVGIIGNVSRRSPVTFQRFGVTFVPCSVTFMRRRGTFMA